MSHGSDSRSVASIQDFSLLCDIPVSWRSCSFGSAGMGSTTRACMSQPEGMRQENWPTSCLGCVRASLHLTWAGTYSLTLEGKKHLPCLLPAILKHQKTQRHEVLWNLQSLCKAGAISSSPKNITVSKVRVYGSKQTL
jgi:hypothetical protein